MSSSNEVRIAAIKEVTKGVTPPTGDFFQFRFSGEGLSGTPETIVSDEIRSDRQPSGQSLVGISVGGQINSKLCASQCFRDAIEAGMKDTWNAQVDSGAETMTIGASVTTLTRGVGSFVTDGFSVGDIIELTGFSDADNNTMVLVTSVAALTLGIVGPDTMSDEVGGGDEHAIRHKYVEIDNDKHYFTLEKKYLDLTDKTIVYRASQVNTLEFSFQNKQEIGFNYSFACGGGNATWETPTTPITDSRTVNDAETETVLNSSVNMGFVAIDGVVGGLCVQNMQLSLNNNQQPTDCIGFNAPTDQTSFEASVTASVTAYLTDSSFDMHDKKMSNTPISVHMFTWDENKNGFAFSVPSLQLSFPDAAASGKNQFVTMQTSGTAKKDTTFGNTFRIYSIEQP